MYLRKAQLTLVKSERLIFSRAPCEGERRARILYLIWHLFTRLSSKRRGVASSHIQKRITTLSLLDGARGGRDATTFRATGTILSSFLCFSSSFVFKAYRGCERDKVVSTNVPIQMSFQKSQIEKKRREDFKRGR